MFVNFEIMFMNFYVLAFIICYYVHNCRTRMVSSIGMQTFWIHCISVIESRSPKLLATHNHLKFDIYVLSGNDSFITGRIYNTSTPLHVAW